ncbi:HD-GYP domain-containing protein [Butyrivibrio hungatei]|uniref:HD family phosphohydrolase n=1 Tax=Butyrivibrio hungatei TaxID=185008 RepID=A0A1D9P2N6_9FIRM|nr:HD domain-containing protein [Butyrivibrio hungatei]AOZ96858.1 HD family phosphohydrolase [Butyrivibrio hungatei]
MLFIKCDELRPGMRLAKPIYNKKGVLLYDRATVLKDRQSIENIKSFGLIGVFILEPAEPVPPMTKEDIEFERFQTVMYNEIMDELAYIQKTHKQDRFPSICAQIIKNYGNLRKKINFQQGLRSNEDYIYKHSLNVAILAAMIAHSMNLSLADQNEAVMAAVIHDIGKLSLDPALQAKPRCTNEELLMIDAHEMAGYPIIDEAFSFLPNIKRACNQARKILLDYWQNEDVQIQKSLLTARILVVAGIFDKETAVRSEDSPVSEVLVIRRMMQRSDVFDQRVVKGLIDSINILSPGSSVELNTGEKALVIRTNEEDFLRPTVLSFRDNSIIDLSNRSAYGELEIMDIMKTMDNRYVMDTAKVKALGISVEEPEYV